jgi:hypothetical protein
LCEDLLQSRNLKLRVFSQEWKKVAAMVKTRTVVQTRTHAQKYFQKFAKAGGGPVNMGTVAGAQGSGSDNDMSYDFGQGDMGDYGDAGGGTSTPGTQKRSGGVGSGSKSGMHRPMGSLNR